MLDTRAARTDLGTVEGVVRSQTITFRGVPYAKPPTGDMRFAPPQAVTPWTGVLRAHEFGPASLQNVDPLSMRIPGAEGYYYQPSGARFSEDCLTLNITAPLEDVENCPVLFWIHGGGFMTGSGSGQWFDATSLVNRHRLVVVTINYRLGILGNLYLGDFDPEATNVGLRDVRMALEWVRDNIRSFGGDPHRVTVMGHSAGAMIVSSLLARGGTGKLFHRAVIHSGNLAMFHSVDESRTTTHRVLEGLHIHEKNPLEALRKTSMVRILELQRSLGFDLAPTIDGDTIPEDPLDRINRGLGADVPLIIGTTGAENNLFHLIGLPRAASGFSLEAGLGSLGIGESCSRVATSLRAEYAGSDPELWEHVGQDLCWRLPMRELADAHSRGGHDTYVFEFRLPSTAEGGILGAAHQVDVPFLFGNLSQPGVEEFLGCDVVRDSGAGSLMDRMTTGLAQFARTGSPNSPDPGGWPRYASTDREVQILDDPVRSAAMSGGTVLDHLQEAGLRDPLFAFFAARPDPISLS